MIPEEAIEIIHEKHIDMEFYFAEHDRYPKYYDFEFDQATLIAAQALKEIQQYREIGTVEECREAMEKQIPKNSKIIHKSGAIHYSCPSCGLNLMEIKNNIQFGHIPMYCEYCGQAIKDEN